MNFDKDKALVILSGGQDSTTCLGWALNKFSEVRCITFDYGQRHFIELQAAMNVYRHFAEHYASLSGNETLALPDSTLHSTSPLLDREEKLDLYSDYDTMSAATGDRVEKTFVPMRNSLFLVIAANRAVEYGYGNLVTGVCQEDNANYPDCRARFIAGMQRAINLSLGTHGVYGFSDDALSIAAPLMHLSKAQTCRLAYDLPHTWDALALTHTAYDGTYPPTSGDHANVLRAHGFLEAGLPDPLVLRAVKEGLMAPPATSNYDGFR